MLQYSLVDILIRNHSANIAVLTHLTGLLFKDYQSSKLSKPH